MEFAGFLLMKIYSDAFLFTVCYFGVTICIVSVRAGPFDVSDKHRSVEGTWAVASLE